MREGYKQHRNISNFGKILRPGQSLFFLVSEETFSPLSEGKKK